MMDFLVRQRRIRRTRKSIVRIKQQAVDGFRYGCAAQTLANQSVLHRVAINE
ncbi:hypothetical protein Rcae01_00218 [Novipirellula caenicola]|uniref:Uncharacterized protein n=1 Tax=Novipirellula caenicola TaxID=1536901 RepID=A0ABP9VHT7_9BACT